MMDDNYIIVASGLTMQYTKKSSSIALNNLDLKLHENQLIGLIGANGSGKTTFFKLCNGLLEPTKGNITLLNGNPTNELYIKENMIYSTNSLPVGNSLKVRQIVKTYAITYKEFDEKFAKEMLKLFEIPENKTLSALSQGMKSILHFCCALACRVKISLLDEPFNGVDIEKRKLAHQILLREYMEHPRTFVISSHHLSELEGVLSEMVLLDKGNLLFYKDMDSVREMLFRVDGAKDEIAAFLERDDVCYQNDGELGGYFVAHGNVNCDFAKEALNKGLKVSPVSPEDVCVYLTTKGKKEAIECLWK